MNSLKSRFFACLLSAVLPAADAHAGELTFTSWGGSYAKAQLDTAVTPFSRSTGVKTRMEEYAGGLDELRRQAFASAYNGRIYAASLRGNKPLRYLWDGQLLSLDGLAIVKGTRNRKDALDFVRYASSPPAMAALAPLTAYGPTRQSAAGLLDAVMMHVLPTAHWYARRSLTVDARWWSTHGEALEQRFTAWAGK